MQTELKIDSNLKQLIPALTEQEFQLLETNILAEGCREPLTVWNEIIIDGHNRYEICQKHKLPYKTIEKKFDSKEEAEIWILSNQLGRRNLTDDQVAIITDELMEKQSKQSKTERAKKGADRRWNTTKECLEETPATEHKSTKRIRQELCELARVSEWQVRKAHRLRKEHPELAEKVLKGKMTLMEASRELAENEKQCKVQAENFEDYYKKQQGKRTDFCQKSDKSFESIDTHSELAEIAGVSHKIFSIFFASEIERKAFLSYWKDFLRERNDLKTVKQIIDCFGELETMVNEIKIRAERKAGQMLKEMAEKKQIAKALKNEKTAKNSPTD